MKSELTSFVRGTAVDTACIGSMIMQVHNPGTFWDYLGNTGSFLQAAFIALGIVVLALLLLSHSVLSAVNRPFTESEDKAAKVFEQFRVSDTYRKAVLGREILFCMVFASMGWIWLALGGLLALFLMNCLWTAGDLEGLPA